MEPTPGGFTPTPPAGGNPSVTADTPTQPNPPAGTGATGTQPNATTQSNPTTLSDDEIRLSKEELLERNRQKNKEAEALRQRALDAENRLAKIDADKRKAEEEQAKQRGEWEKIATQRQAEIDALKPQAEQAKSYAEVLNKLIDHEIKDWPKEVKEFLPGTDNALERYAQVEKARPLAHKLLGTATGGRGGNPPNPNPANGATPSDLKQEMRRSGRGGYF